MMFDKSFNKPKMIILAEVPQTGKMTPFLKPLFQFFVLSAALSIIEMLQHNLPGFRSLVTPLVNGVLLKNYFLLTDKTWQ
jgi:hypothetical protein